ncbi:hypothetical protein ABR769_25455 [Bacillus cereus]|uniref:hypothetical protein n=1 Tax=Bacillus cereus TaxID=1396 RepID=UPI0001A12394|nr:hypothetical protein [Bacillus cereus]EEL73374.1 hypothetical protein bcere0027_52930 [Bacillus cereus AH676]
MIKQNVIIGQDDYGRDIYGQEDIPDVHCRFDQIEKRVDKNDYSFDIIIQPILYLAASQEIEETMLIKDIRDKQDDSLLPGVYGVKKLSREYSKIRLHHYEVELKKERD